MSDEAIRIVAPMIMDVRASARYQSDPHVTWSIGYAPEADEDGGRVLFASIHAAGAEGRVDVELAATQYGGGFSSELAGDEAEVFAERLAQAEALAALYDIARITARGLVGTVDIGLEIPHAGPAPKITQLVRSPGTAT